MSIDLNGLKNTIQTLLQNANTTTASRDLSSGLESRVQAVMKVNPSRIPVQSTWYPFVTTYIAAKSVEMASTNISQAAARRKAEVDILIAGAVWNSTISNQDADDASDDAESLMENIEEIIRANPTLGGTVTWCYPTTVKYFATQVEEEASVRAGILSLKTIVFY